MVMSCCAYGCTARQVGDGSRGFHRFPVDPVKCALWVRAIRRKDFTPTIYTVICSDHFSMDAYDTSRQSGFCKRRYLKSDAVPTIFNFPQHLQPKKLKCHKPPTNRSVDEPLEDVELDSKPEIIDEDPSICTSVIATVETAQNQAPRFRKVRSRCAFGCAARAVTGEPRSYHTFPADPVKRALWVEAIGRKDFTPSASAYICCDHFDEDAYDWSGYCKRRYLKSDAVPTIFNFAHLQPKKFKCHNPQATRSVAQLLKDLDQNTESKEEPRNHTPIISFAEDANDQTKQSSYLKLDALPTIFKFPRLPRKKLKRRRLQATRSVAELPKDVDQNTEPEEIKEEPPNNSSIVLPVTPLRYLSDCDYDETDTILDLREKLSFALSACRVMKKQIKGLQQYKRRMSKRFKTLKDKQLVSLVSEQAAIANGKHRKKRLPQNKSTVPTTPQTMESTCATSEEECVHSPINSTTACILVVPNLSLDEVEG